MTRSVRAILITYALLVVVTAGSRAQDDDAGPLEVLSSDELAQPVLVCTPSAVSLTASRDVVKTFRITVRNAGGRVLHWSVASVPAWAVPDARSGKVGFRGEEDLVLNVYSTRLKPGISRGVIVIDAPGAKGSPARISISVTYAAKPKGPARDRRRPKPPAGRRPVPTRKPSRRPPPGEYRGKRFGVRIGVALPGTSATQMEDSTAFRLGFRCRLGRLRRSAVTYEAGLDLLRGGGSYANSDEFDNTLLGGRIDVLFGRKDTASSARGYLLTGFSGFLEFVDPDPTLGSAGNANSAGALDLGAGIALGHGRFDLRAVYCVLLGNDNMSGMTFLSAAFCF